MKRRALREARGILLVLGGCWLVALLWTPAISLLFAVLVLFTLYFFRDPERTPPADTSLAVSPADGKVVDVFEVDEAEFLHVRVRRVVIFLSVFDVHVNRAPLAGEILRSEAATGRFLDARNPESSRLNARRTWVIRGPQATVVVRQITGAIARRICAWKRVGAHVERGERFGMIRFGSRTEVDLPLDAEILVKPGDCVQGGSTAIARLGPLSAPPPPA